jgi:hydrogenase/urease accessory protein HupE
MRVLLAALMLLCGTLPAAADTLRPAYVEFTQATAHDWQLVWRLPVQADLTPHIRPILPRGCTIVEPPERQLTAMSLVNRARARCSAPVAGRRIGMRGLELAQTDVIVRVAPLGRPAQTLRLTPARPMATIAAKAGRWQVATSYFWIGVEHIVFGYDHLLFVLAFVLLLDGVGRIAVAVTAFTVAHSLTLAGTTLGLIGLPAAPVESVIALSIIFLAVEILKKTPGEPRLSERAPWIVALAFGLLHGFGFAGALSAIGLPEGEVPMALFAFNVGVEVGQIAMVLAASVVLALLRNFATAAAPHVVRLCAYAIGTVAGIWFVERLFA